MVGLKMFSVIDKRLKEAGDSNKLFGGFSMIFLGDCWQLFPVKDLSLMQSTYKESHPLTKRGRIIGNDFIDRMGVTILDQVVKSNIYLLYYQYN